jgi:hypothetical protein
MKGVLWHSSSPFSPIELAASYVDKRTKASLMALKTERSTQEHDSREVNVALFGIGGSLRH